MSAKSQSATWTPERQLRTLAWTYIALLILEGALRKWFLPSLSNLLLLARDPIVLLAYAIAIHNRCFPRNKYVVTSWILMGLSFLFTLLFAHGNFIVAAFGFRANVLHIPFAFIMGRVFYREDVIQIGKWWLLGSIGMTVLISLQYYSPQSAWVNQGLGGSGSAGFSGALGRFRPPGTFSFIIGVVWFYVFATAFLMGGFTQHKRYPKWLLIAASFAICVALPVSISRMMVLACAITFFVALFAASLKAHTLKLYLRITFFSLIGILCASLLPIFDDARNAFMARWEMSTDNFYEAIIDRTLMEFLRPFILHYDVPFFGHGLGAGTQAGRFMLDATRGFSLGEADWERVVNENGVLFGGLFLLWRVALTLKLAQYALRAFRKGNGLGLILLSATAYNLLVGPLGQTTICGFVIIGIGLTIASMRTRGTPTPPQNEHQTSS